MSDDPNRALLDKARRDLPSGNYLPLRARAGATRVLVVATEHDPEALAALADDLSWLQMDHPYVKPVLLLNATEVSSIRKRGFVYETAVSADMWPAVDASAGSYATYLQQRVIEMVTIYDPKVTVVATPGVPLPRSLFTKS